MASGEARKERLRKQRKKSPNNHKQRQTREKMLLKTLPQRKKGHRHAFKEEEPQREMLSSSSIRSWIVPYFTDTMIKAIEIQIYRFEGALLDDDIQKCEKIYKEISKVNLEVLQHLRTAIRTFKRGDKTTAYDTVKQTREDFESTPSLTIEDVKREAKKGVGVCYEKSMYLLKGVKLLDPEAKFMAVMDRDNIPIHYYVYSPVYGNLDGFPPGNPSGILNGVPINISWTKVIYMDVCNRIIRLECERAVKYIKEGKDCDGIFVYLVQISAKDPERWRYRDLINGLDNALQSPNPEKAIKQMEIDLTRTDIKETDYKGPIYD